MKKIKRTRVTVWSTLLLFFLFSTSASAIWYGQGANGDRTPFGTYDNSTYGSSSSGITIPVSKSPDEDKYFGRQLFFAAATILSFLYFFAGEGNFKNKKEDTAVRYVVLGVAIVCVGLFIYTYNKSNKIVTAWNSAHPKEAAFAKIVNEESRVSAIRDRAKSELNMDLDSLLEKHGIHSSSNPHNSININFSPKNSQSQTIYR